MFSITFREGVLVLMILGALIVGAMVKHWRDAYREQPLPASASPSAEQPR